MSASLHPQTEARLDAWRHDPEVLGVVLVGSRARGHADAMSDDDLEVILTDAAYAQVAPVGCAVYAHLEASSPRRLIYDAQLLGIGALEAKASSTLDLDRWPYEQAPILFERGDAVSGAVRAAGRMDDDFRLARVRHGAVDVWLTTHRAEKTLGRGFEAAGRQIVAKGTKALARVMFALEGRWVPLDHWLEPELATLEDAAGAAECLKRALIDTEPAALGEALERLQDHLGAFGFPPGGPERRELFLTLVHPSLSAERRLHGLP